MLERMNDSPKLANPGFKPRSISLWRIQPEGILCVFCLSPLSLAPPVPGADLHRLLLSGALILHLAVCQEEADAGGWRMRRASSGLRPALLLEPSYLHNHDVIMLSPARPFRVGSPPCRAFGQRTMHYQAGWWMSGAPRTWPASVFLLSEVPSGGGGKPTHPVLQLRGKVSHK